MLRLRILGGLSIATDDSPLSGAAARRRSLALLALAASAGDAGVSDEHALALLWPDSDSVHARNNLKQVVFTLRHSLRREVFLRSATSLRLDPSIVSVDRWDFERAFVEGDAVRAITLYSGPFLGGFHISGLAEFERWVETERDRLAHVHMDALMSLASAADDAGDHLGASAWWRRLVAEDPLNDVNAQKLIRALACAGDTAGALQQARVHETLVAQELDLTPSPAFQRFVQDIRAGHLPSNGTITSSARVTTPPFAVQALPMATTVRPEPSRQPPGGGNGVAPHAPEELSKRIANEPAARGVANSAAAQRNRRVWHTAERRIAGFTTRFTVAAVVLVVVGTAATVTVRQSGPLFTADSERGSAVVVPPFAVNAGSGAGNLGAVVSELLATSLDGSLGLRALAVGWSDRKADTLPGESLVTRRVRAQRLATNLGANLYVSGEVFESGDRVRITAEFRSRQDEAPLDRAVVEGTRGELFDLVDRVASQLLASRIDGGRRDVVRVASVTTSSLPAAKAYFNGEAALAAGSFRTAIDSYREALQLDPSFALAHYGLSNAADMLGDDALVQRAASQALQYAQRLPSRQKRLLAAFMARIQGDVAGAKRLYSELTTDYPADAEAWLGLGETLFHLNPLDGQPVTEARSAFEHASDLDPKNTGALVHLARIAALDGDEARSRRMVARARALAPDPAVARFALHVLSLGVPFDDPAAGRTRRAVTGLAAADAVALLTRAGRDDLLRFATRLAAGDAREYGLQLQSLVEAGQGRITRAMALLDTCSASNHRLAIEAQSRLAALSFIPMDVAELERIRSEVFAWTPDIHAIEDPIDSVAHVVSYPYMRLHRLGLLSLRLNDTAAVQALAGQLDDMAKAAPSNASAQLLAASLRAHIAATRSRPRKALALLQGTTAGRVTSATSLEAYDRLLYAQLLEQTGRDDEALRFYSQLGSRSLFEFAFVWQAELGMARIHAKRGERTMAARYYKRVAERLRDADSTLLNVRDDAERLAASLMLN